MSSTGRINMWFGIYSEEEKKSNKRGQLTKWKSKSYIKQLKQCPIRHTGHWNILSRNIYNYT